MKVTNSIILVGFLIVLTMSNTVYADTPREEQLEQAFLQQVHTTVQSSMRSIYNEKYAQYSCEQIRTINERTTILKKKPAAMPVDAIHGQKYFEVTIGLLRSNDEYVELNLKNDLASGQYYLVNHKIGAIPADFKCRPAS